MQALTYTKTVEKDIRTWEDLRGLKIGILRGTRYAAIGTRGMDPYVVNDVSTLFLNLDRGRIDVAIATQLSGTAELEQQFAANGIHPIGKVLYEAPLYHYLHIRHQALVEPLKAVLVKMAADDGVER